MLSFEISFWENNILLDIFEEYFFENSFIDLWFFIFEDLTSIGTNLLLFVNKKSIPFVVSFVLKKYNINLYHLI